MAMAWMTRDSDSDGDYGGDADNIECFLSHISGTMCFFCNTSSHASKVKLTCWLIAALGWLIAVICFPWSTPQSESSVCTKA